MKGTYLLKAADDSVPLLPGDTGRLGFDPGGLPVIYTSITIQGNGAIIQRSSQDSFGIFQVSAGGSLTLRDLTVSGGDSSASDFSQGGAIELMVGQVVLDHVTLTGNRSYDGGALSVGLGASAILTDSIIHGNYATDDGGGIYNSGSLTVKNSSIDQNVAQDDVIGGGGIYNDSGSFTLEASTLSGNLATEGGGIYNDGGTVEILNGSIISGNMANEQNSDIPHGGVGINSITSGGPTASVTIDSSYIIGNQAPGSTGGGIYNQGNLMVTGSVLTGNISGGGGALFNDINGTGSISGSCFLKNLALGVSPAGYGSDIENGSDTTFEASQNWWGSTGNPGSNISQRVDAGNILSNPPGICTGILPTPYPTPGG